MTSSTEPQPDLIGLTNTIVGMFRDENPSLDIHADSSLLDGGLDSLRVMSLVLKIEIRWDIELDADDSDDLRTVTDLARLVLRRIEEKQ